MRILLLKCCEYAMQQQNGRHSMIGIFDNIVAPYVPIDHPPFFLCAQFEFSPEEAETQLEATILLLDPDGQKLLDIAAEGEVPKEASSGPIRLFMQFGIPGVRFDKTGDHRVDVFANGTKIGEELLPVLVASRP
ncbi:MAG: hypothetical protein AB7F50_01055 [Fimbriimonadaceae bacterium]